MPGKKFSMEVHHHDADEGRHCNHLFMYLCTQIVLLSHRLQAVMCIISTIMESCPSTSSFYSTAAAKAQHNGMNNIIRLFLKKGLVNDLARVPHSLDLSRYVTDRLFNLFRLGPINSPN